jgi:hypothetical protein
MIPIPVAPIHFDKLAAGNALAVAVQAMPGFTEVRV